MSQRQFMFVPSVLANLALFTLIVGLPGSLLGQAPDLSPGQLVRHVIQAELQAARNDKSHWMYRQHHLDPDSNEVKECVETGQGALCRKLEENGRKLSTDSQAHELQKMQTQLTDESERRRQEKSRKEDADKALAMLKILPLAFIYTEEGRDNSSINLSFRPNPDFKPASHEARVLHAMAGTLSIDKTAMRLKTLKGHLLKNVEFGGGLLGHLDKGGTFEVRRTNVGYQHWETTLLDVDIHGKALFFKTINARQHEVTGYFHRVADDLTFARGFDLLTAPIAAPPESNDTQALARSR